jgi:hypothetical protein
MSTISTSGISPSQVIRAEHILRIIRALDGTSTNDVIISGSLDVSGSVSASFFIGDGSQLTNLPTQSGNPEGSDTQIQFNSGSVFGGDSSFTFIYVSQSLQQGLSTQALGLYSHAEGDSTQAIGDYSHAEGYLTQASGSYSHAEGYLTQAIGEYSHAQGRGTQAIGILSHAEGESTEATGYASHAEGGQTISSGSYSHAEGDSTQAIGEYSHAEGKDTQAIGDYSHAEGSFTQAIGQASHAEGLFTVALGSTQHVQGQYNISSSAVSAFIIGNGISEGSRSNLVFASGSEFQVTGSISITNVLTLTPNNPLPSGQPTGSISVSGSGVDCKPYFYNGTTWTSLI